MKKKELKVDTVYFMRQPNGTTREYVLMCVVMRQQTHKSSQDETRPGMCSHRLGNE